LILRQDTVKREGDTRRRGNSNLGLAKKGKMKKKRKSEGTYNPVRGGGNPLYFIHRKRVGSPPGRKQGKRELGKMEKEGKDESSLKNRRERR